jgi:hypothetical protein
LKPVQANNLQDPLSKNPKIGLMEWLKVKALSSNPSTTKKKKKKKRTSRDWNGTQCRALTYHA